MARKLHSEEAQHYVTMENLDEILKTELFESKPSSTGLSFGHSKYWQYQVVTNSLFRLNNEEPDEKGWANRPFDEAANRTMVMDYLNSMVGTGEDREKFEEHVQRVVDQYPLPVGGTLAGSTIEDDELPKQRRTVVAPVKTTKKPQPRSPRKKRG